MNAGPHPGDRPRWRDSPREIVLPAQPFETPARRAMVKYARLRFQSAGWVVTTQGTESIDFEIRRSHLALPVKCVDASAWTYKHPDRVVEQMQIESAQLMRSFHITLVWLVQPEPSAPSPARMFDLGCLAFSPDEIDLVINLSRFDEALPRDLAPRENALFCSSLWECIRISNAFKAQGEPAGAIHWMRCAVRASPGFSAAYWALLKLLLDAGDVAGAEAVAERALALRPEAEEFAEAVRDFAASRGDKERAETWKARRAEASVKRPRQPSFEDIIRKQAISGSDRDRASQQAAERKPPGRRWFRAR
jgi:tetratricopeptide (TPR) repeat protein